MVDTGESETSGHQGRTAGFALGLLAGGIVLLCAALMSGAQSIIFTALPISLGSVSAALLISALALQRRWLRAILIALCALALVAGILVALYVHVLAAGFSQMR